MREVLYKGYLIRACSEEIKSVGWTAKARVFWNEGGKMIEQELSWPERSQIFKTEEEADDYTLEMAKRWIDSR